MDAYAIPPHVFWCHCERSVVFLDLRADRYFAAPVGELRALTRPVIGISDPRPANASVLHDAQLVGELERTLLHRELLVRTTERDSTMKRQQAPHASRTLLQSEGLNGASGGPTRSPTFGTFWNFAIALLVTLFQLQAFSLERVVSRSVAKRPCDCAATSTEKVSRLLAAFRFCRALTYSSYNRCLFDTLLLVHFLARYDVFPCWIFGVKLEPFAAHCWVQLGETVLDDTLDRIGRYSPIMTV